MDNNTQRLDKLLDYRILSLKDDIIETKNSVLRIEKILIGNGSEGLIQKVSRNCANIKIILWGLSIIVGGAVAGGAIINNNRINKVNIIPPATAPTLLHFNLK